MICEKHNVGVVSQSCQSTHASDCIAHHRRQQMSHCAARQIGQIANQPENNKCHAETFSGLKLIVLPDLPMSMQCACMSFIIHITARVAVLTWGVYTTTQHAMLIHPVIDEASSSVISCIPMAVGD